MRRAMMPAALATLAVVVTGGIVVGGLAILGSDGDQSAPRSQPTATASFTTTPLSSYDAAGVAIARGAFCDRVDPRQITAAIGGAPASQRSWVDGDRTRLGGGPVDVSHEYGCEYVGADGSTARAWVFAPPVRTGTASRLARQTDGTGSCAATPAAFGSPSGLLTCETGNRRSATYRGLFGDAWLSCELDAPLTTPAADLADEAGRWCVGVAQAARASG